MTDSNQLLKQICTLLEDNARRMEAMQQEIWALREEIAGQSPDWISKEEARAMLGVSDRTLERYHNADYCQRQGWSPLLKGVHSTEARPIRFNRPLLEDWLIHRTNHRMHQRAISKWQNKLPSYQKRKVK